MSEQPTPQLNKVPFQLADLVLLGVAWYVASQAPRPLPLMEFLIVIGAVAAGAVVGILPYLVEYRALTRLAESELLSATIRQLNNLESIARNVTAATAQWHGVQSLAAQTNKSAKEIADQMSAELSGLTDFLRKSNDSERANLRLEVEKLRRVEGEWLQVVVGIMDHVSALHRAAAHSGQPALVQQLGAFQHACRDIARRVGVSLLEARPGEEFDAERHRLPSPDAESPDEAVVADVLVPGVAFQGRLLRPTIVTVRAMATVAVPPSSGVETAWETGSTTAENDTVSTPDALTTPPAEGGGQPALPLIGG
jgi:molecular chaperone GrpE (heat shock protein)